MLRWKETKSWWSCPHPRRRGTNVGRTVGPGRQCYVGLHSLQLLHLPFSEDTVLPATLILGFLPSSLHKRFISGSQNWVTNVPCGYFSSALTNKINTYPATIHTFSTVHKNQNIFSFKTRESSLYQKEKKRTPYYALEHFKIGEIPKHVQGTLWEMRIPADKVVAVS